MNQATATYAKTTTVEMASLETFLSLKNQDIGPKGGVLVVKSCIIQHAKISAIIIEAF